MKKVLSIESLGFLGVSYEKVSKVVLSSSAARYTHTCKAGNHKKQPHQDVGVGEVTSTLLTYYT